jgi:GR25 family glycosyltransferase involved in LPS biosynthesis
MILDDDNDNDVPSSSLLLLEWDATRNAQWDPHIDLSSLPSSRIKTLSPGEVGCALSHIQLWTLAVETLQHDRDAILILEDDAVFYYNTSDNNHNHHHTQQQQQQQKQQSSSSSSKQQPRSFETLFDQAWKELPSDWDIWYLGFSDRGERIPVDNNNNTNNNNDDSSSSSSVLQWFRPTYGFHTHAYALTKRAASHLLSRLPIVGPIDVWLADNQWFDLHVYCCVVKNEGWKGTGKYLITQDRRRGEQSNIVQSGRKTRTTTTSPRARLAPPSSLPTIILLQVVLLIAGLLCAVSNGATAGPSTTTAATTTAKSSSSPLSPPHILFILVDDLGWGNVGYHVDSLDVTRQREVQTPVIDRLATVEGLELNRHCTLRCCWSVLVFV